MNKFLTILILSYLISTPCLSEDRKFKLGIIIPLSGALSEYGTAIKNGFELAKVNKPDSFNNITYVYEDSGYDANTAITALNSIKSKHNVNLYYMWGVSPTESMLPIAERENLAVIAETTLKKATVGKKLTVRAARTGERIAKALVHQIKEKKLKRISIIVTQIPFYIDIVDYLIQELKSEGLDVVNTFEVLPDELDFKSQISRIKTNKSDSVGLFLLPDQLINFYKQQNIFKLNILTFNADLLDSTNVVKECPDTINGAFFTQVGVTEEFRNNYMKYSKSDIHIGSAAQAYDIANLVGDLFNDSNDLKPEDIIKKISLISPRHGATGYYRYSDTPDSGKELRMPVSLKVIRDKKIEILIDNTNF